MSEPKVVVKSIQGAWVASIFHNGADEHRAFRTQEEADQYGKKRAKALTDREG
ncbi:hypothetical protein QO002_005810 [Pararhizobium capsulatum DSM 1112]|uniref:DUF2188 domain-containing protein n=1 Tax=Pararhizobium capsulatum DSM 1112 TaxID=1121113 RepID=A0ABU0C100_9HYPH|nr:hypothetical protein [Pararhizobium capsulatum]MDQ0323604.1 hypothetical protein [Pararhizobium capsulatum DSM 1112]